MALINSTYSKQEDLFVLVGDKSILTSSDGGNTWTNRINDDIILYNIVYGNGVYCAFGTSNNDSLTVQYNSIDGINWTSKKLLTTKYIVLNCIYTRSNGLFLALSIESLNTYLT